MNTDGIDTNNVQTWSSTLVSPAQLTLGEGALWHPEWKKFLFVDINEHLVGTFDPDNGSVETVRLAEMVSLVLPASDGRLLVAMQNRLSLLDWDSKICTDITAIEPEDNQTRCNDGACDSRGRLWIGTMQLDALPGRGTLYRYDDQLTAVVKNVSISNGICWSLNNTFMYYIDTAQQCIWEYEYDLLTGQLGKSRICVRMSAEDHYPDGMCIDDEGMLWVAIWGGAAVHRYDPLSGMLIGQITVDAPNVTNCAFGGKNNSNLFITTARAGLSDMELKNHQHSGALFVASVGCSGPDPNYYKTPCTL